MARRRSANPNLHPHKLRSPERLDDGFDPVVSAMATGQLDPQPCWLQIKIVMDNNEFAGGELEFAQEAFQRRAGNIHPVEQASQLDQFTSESPGTSLSCAAR